MTNPQPQYNAGDYLAMALLYSAYGLVTYLSFGLSGLFVMATDSCGVDCDTSGIDRAYLIMDGGAAVLFAAVCVFGLRALITHRTWVSIPLSAIAIQGLLFVIGASQATSAVPS